MREQFSSIDGRQSVSNFLSCQKRSVVVSSQLYATKGFYDKHTNKNRINRIIMASFVECFKNNNNMTKNIICNICTRVITVKVTLNGEFLYLVSSSTSSIYRATCSSSHLSTMRHVSNTSDRNSTIKKTVLFNSITVSTIWSLHRCGYLTG